MAKLRMFNLITLDGYFKGRAEDISWHNFSEDEQQLSDEASNRGGILVFGRVTYEMMESYWTSPDALKNDPVTAKGMNQSQKLVFSKTISEARWQNTRLFKGDMIEEIKRMKKESKTPMTILGSGQIVAQLSEAGLIDDYQILLNPVALGDGTSLFEGLSRPMKLKLNSVREMKSGNVLLNYGAL
jgi:dihydrofolate reductase